MVSSNTFLTTGVVFSVAQGQSTQATTPIGTPIWEAYSGLTARPLYAAVAPQVHFESHAADICNFPLDIVLVQDHTLSFSPNAADMLGTQLQEMSDALNKYHPNSRIGIMAFRDKPVPTFGEAGDYCYAHTMALSPLNVEQIRMVYSRTPMAGGGDPAENQLQAAMASLNDPVMGWDTTGEHAKLVIIATDSWPHFADDGLNKLGLKPFSGDVNWNDFSNQCLLEYYPTPNQAFEAVAIANAYMGVLIFDGFQPNITRKSWDWINSYIGQPSLFVEPLANNASDFWVKLSNMISAIEHHECRKSSSTSTMVPTVSQPSTTGIGSTTSTSTQQTTASTTTAASTTGASTTSASTAASTTSASTTSASPAVSTTSASTTSVTTAAPTTGATTTTTTTSVTSAASTTSSASSSASTTGVSTSSASTAAPTPTSSAATTANPSVTSTARIPTSTTSTPVMTATVTEASRTATSGALSMSTSVTTQPATATQQSVSTSGAATMPLTSAPDGSTPCGGDGCPCPEVLIALKRRPVQMHLDMANPPQ